ncbi:hypothetical protein HK097_004586 [Rhizophlyctis rosea]|uniref:Uncharacterized protein n=1 Tax=Rhizophlyctis rosea TaxID=64517 RepID=A0AAD5WXB1_9FUNG|nr:hypothetical protein HK097_004586 [Rhizophlyctis rosea]
MTLALNGHILLTNGPDKHQLALWDLSKRPSASDRLPSPLQPPPLHILSESEAMRKMHFEVPGFRDLKFAELSRDGTCVFGSVRFERDLTLLCWDFRERERSGVGPGGEKGDGNKEGMGKRTRKFERRSLDGLMQIDFWLCYDEVEEW